MQYMQFLSAKSSTVEPCGFEYDCGHHMLFDWQEHLVKWSTMMGRSALFADCGLGKTVMQLAWADAVARRTSGRVIILTPLAVAEQTVREAKKFMFDGVVKSKDGACHRLTVTNYERLHAYDPSNFEGIVCDESSILKNYAGVTRQAITDFSESIPYRMLCSATPAPNDYMEIGTSSEALGIMRRVEMLAKFFTHNSGNTQKWELKGHGKAPFWAWLASWSRALRSPSDIGFPDGEFVLPSLDVQQHTVASAVAPGALFVTDAVGLTEQRAERRRTIPARCDNVADIANANNEPFLAWCSLNDESEQLAKRINGAVELRGSDSADEKERKLMAFTEGAIRCLVTKPSIAGFGMNWQHCNQMSFFPSHSYEQYYQAVRRCWRFGQKRPVSVHIVTSEAERGVIGNMQKKEKAASEMFDAIVANMRSIPAKSEEKAEQGRMEVPSWLATRSSQTDMRCTEATVAS